MSSDLDSHYKKAFEKSVQEIENMVDHLGRANTFADGMFAALQIFKKNLNGGLQDGLAGNSS